MKPARIALAVVVVVVMGWASPARAENRVFAVAGDGSEGSGPYRGGAATDVGLFGLVGEIAVDRGGGFLVGMDDPGPMVLRVSSTGRIRRVAGGPEYGFRGDGGPATRARLFFAGDISAAEDGGFLFLDWCRVRAVGRDGIITTVAGSARRTCEEPDKVGPAPGDGGPATAARLRYPHGVAAMPDGGFLVSDGNRVRRVSPNGTITTVAGTGAASTPGAPVFGQPATSVALSALAVAPARDGGFLVSDQNGVHRVRPDGVIVPAAGPGTILTGSGHLYTSVVGPLWQIRGPLPERGVLLAEGRSDYFPGYGEPATRVPVPTFEDVEATPDGGLLVAVEGRVLFSAPARTRRLGVAVARETLPGLLHGRLRFRLTRPARVKIRLYRGRRVVVRRTVPGRKGLTTVRLPRGIKPGLRFAKLRATTRDGAVATDGLKVLVGDWLPTKVATVAISREFACFGECGPILETVKPCRRFGPRRVDCVMEEVDLDTGERTACTGVYSAVRRRSGYLYLRAYGCRKRKRMGYFRRRLPRAPERQAPPL